MANGEDWLMRPAIEGLVLYTAYKNCEIDLEDVCRMNDALDIRAENENRLAKAAERKK